MHINIFLIREAKIIELENVEVKFPDPQNKKIQLLVTCYEVKHRRYVDKDTGKLRPVSDIYCVWPYLTLLSGYSNSPSCPKSSGLSPMILVSNLAQF